MERISLIRFHNLSLFFLAAILSSWVYLEFYKIRVIDSNQKTAQKVEKIGEHMSEVGYFHISQSLLFNDFLTNQNTISLNKAQTEMNKLRGYAAWTDGKFRNWFSIVIENVDDTKIQTLTLTIDSLLTSQFNIQLNASDNKLDENNAPNKLEFVIEELNNSNILITSNLNELKKQIKNHFDKKIQFGQNRVNLLYIINIGFLFLFIFGMYIHYKLFKKYLFIPLLSINIQTYKVSQGSLNNITLRKGFKEVHNILTNLKILIENLQSKFSFIQDLAQNNFTTEIQSAGTEDKIFSSISELKENLIKSRDLEIKRKSDDEQRNWISEGLAKFGDILRNNNLDINNLSYSIISNLVKYVHANQGGIFLLNTTDPENVYVEQISCFAYDRYRMKQKQIKPDEGLICRCLFEKETIHLKEIPENYLTITSGLGYENPKNLVIVPMIMNNNVLGVIEISSFNSFEPFHISFIERLAESIASTIFNVRNNQKTNEYLVLATHNAEEFEKIQRDSKQNIASLKEEINNLQLKLQNSVFVNETQEREINDLHSKVQVFSNKYDAKEIILKQYKTIMNESFSFIETDKHGKILQFSESVAKILGNIQTDQFYYEFMNITAFEFKKQTDQIRIYHPLKTGRMIVHNDQEYAVNETIFGLYYDDYSFDNLLIIIDFNGSEKIA